MNDRSPRIVCVVPHFIRPSEAWMHRQLRYLDQTLDPGQLRVIAYQHHHRPEFTLDHAEVITVPESHNRPLKSWRRRIDKVLAPGCGGLRFGSRHRDWLCDQIARFEPDAIHCQYGTFGLSTLYAVRSLGVPVFTQFNGHDLSSYIRRRRPRQQMIAALNDFGGLVAVARYQYQWLIQQGADPGRVALIPYGAPLEPGRPDRPAADRPTTDPAGCRFLAVGRLCEMKSPLDLIAAFARCRERSPRSSLRIIGDGELRGQTQELIDRWGLSGAVTLLGVQPPDVVRAEMLSADVFVQHSVTAPDGMMEGWPVAIGEAINRGLPVVATRHAGIVQQVDDGVSGYLVAEHDWSAMGDRMAELAGDAELRTRMRTQTASMRLDCDDQTGRQLEFIRHRLRSIAGRGRSPLTRSSPPTITSSAA